MSMGVGVLAAVLDFGGPDRVGGGIGGGGRNGGEGWNGMGRGGGAGALGLGGGSGRPEDWKASLAARAWSTCRAAAYHPS